MEAWDGTREGADRIFEAETAARQTELELSRSLDTWVMRIALAAEKEAKKNLVDKPSERA